MSGRSDASLAAARQRLRLALTATEAAASLGVSRDFFDEHIAEELAVVRRGRLRLYPLRAIEAWLERAAEPPLGRS